MGALHVWALCLICLGPYQPSTLGQYFYFTCLTWILNYVFRDPAAGCFVLMLCKGVSKSNNPAISGWKSIVQSQRNTGIDILEFKNQFSGALGLGLDLSLEASLWSKAFNAEASAHPGVLILVSILGPDWGTCVFPFGVPLGGPLIAAYMRACGMPQSLTRPQMGPIDCGLREGLWDAPAATMHRAASLIVAHRVHLLRQLRS